MTHGCSMHLKRPKIILGSRVTGWLQMGAEASEKLLMAWEVTMSRFAAGLMVVVAVVKLKMMAMEMILRAVEKTEAMIQPMTRQLGMYSVQTKALVAVLLMKPLRLHS